MGKARQTTAARRVAVAAVAIALSITHVGPVALAQTDLGPQWLERFGTPARDMGRAVATGADGAVFTVGNSVTYLEETDEGWIRRGPDDAFVTRHDPGGRREWTVRLEATDATEHGEGAVIPDGAAIAPDGDLVIAGRTRGALPGETQQSQPSPRSGGDAHDAFIARFAPDGQLRWVTQFGADELTDAAAVAVGPDGSSYVAGYTFGTLPGMDPEEDDGAYLARYDADGARVWVRGIRESATGVAVGADGDLHVLEAPWSFEDEEMVPLWAVYDAADGAERATHDLRDHGFDSVYPITTGPDGDVWIGGVHADGSDETARAARFDPDGTPKWAVSAPNPHPHATGRTFVADLAIDTGGTLMLAGSAMLDPPSVQRRFTGFVARMGPDGSLSWFHNAAYDHRLSFTGVDVDGAGGIYVTGPTFGGADPAERAFLARFARDAAPGSGPSVADPDPGMDRVAGADRFATAAAVAERFDPAFVHTVYLTTGRNFPDALAAGPAAVLEGAPILLTDPARLVDSTRAALERLDPERLVVLGGQSAISDAVAQEAAAAAGASVERVSGADRHTTAAALAARVTAFGDPPFVSLATGVSFPDALAGGALAADVGAPILLTPSASLAGPSAEVLGDVRPDRVLVFGGESALSQETARAAGEAAGGAPVIRLAGGDRFETAATIAAEFAAPVSEVLVATGTSFPDALAGTPLAGLLRVPLILVHPDRINPSVEEQLHRLQPERITILGGDQAVSPAVAERLEDFVR